MSLSSEDTAFIVASPLSSYDARTNANDSRHNDVHNDIENIPPNGGTRLKLLEHEAHKIMQPPGKISPSRRIYAESLSDYPMVSRKRNDIDASILPLKYSFGLSDNRGNMQPANSTDLELATALGHRMVVEVRRLQAELSEKDALLQQLHNAAETSEVWKKELEAKIKIATDNEENLRNTNWELEIRLQNLEEDQAAVSEVQSRLDGENARLLSANHELHNNIENLQSNLESLHMDIKTNVSQHTMSLHDQKAIQDSLRDDNDILQRKIVLLEADVRRQATDLVAASVDPVVIENTADVSGTESENSPSERAAPVSPIKGTPYRNIDLESETMKGTLNHHQSKMLRQRKELEREKRLRMQTQLELRERESELHSLQQILGSQTPRRRVVKPNESSARRHAKTRKTGEELERVQLSNTEEWEVVADQCDRPLLHDQIRVFSDKSPSSSPHISSGIRTNRHQTWLSEVELSSHHSSEDELASADAGSPSEPASDGESSRRSSGTVAQACALEDELQCLSGDLPQNFEKLSSTASALPYDTNAENAAMRKAKDSIVIFEDISRHASQLVLSYRNVGTQTSMSFAGEPSLQHTKQPVSPYTSMMDKSDLLPSHRYSMDQSENSPFATLDSDSKPMAKDNQLQPRDQISVMKSRWLELVANETELIASRIAIQKLVETNAAMSHQSCSMDLTAQAHEVTNGTAIIPDDSDKQHEAGTRPSSCSFCSTSVVPIAAQSRSIDSVVARRVKSGMAPPQGPSTAQGTLRGRQMGSPVANSQFGKADMQTSSTFQDHADVNHKQDYSTTSSVSSFISEIEQCFHAPANVTYISTPAEISNTKIIESITKTMIGMSMYKYTRKAGRQNLSSNRHKRYFWLHPYTKTLYWSVYNPVSAPDNAIIKSAVVLSMNVEDDFNPLPPGLHQKSICIETPQRMLKLTTVHSTEHEVWLQALRFLLDGPAIDPALQGAQPLHKRLSIADQPDTSLVLRNRAPLASMSRLKMQSDSRVSPIAFTDDNQDTGQRLPRIFTAAPLARLSSKISLDDVAGIDGLENVRACCGGRHNVGNLCARSTRSRSSSRVRRQI